MKHFNKLITAELTLTIAIALLCSACAPGNTVALAETPEPTPSATAAPTPTPSPTPEPTPTPEPVAIFENEYVRVYFTKFAAKQGLIMFRVENLTNSMIYIDYSKADAMLLIDGEPFTASMKNNTATAGGVSNLQIWTINITSGNSAVAKPIDENAKTAEFVAEFSICDKSEQEITRFMLPAIDLTSAVYFPAATTAPITDLTDEEAKKEIELLGMTFDPDTEIPITMPIIIFCSGLNEKGEENFFIEFAYLGEKQSSNTMIIATFWNQNEIFEFPQNSTNSIEDMLDGVLVAPRYGSLHGVELEQVSVLINLAYFCKQYGIRINKVNTQIGKEITASQGIGFEQDLTFTYEEFADYYVRAFAEENRMSAADYTDPIPYTPRTPAP